MTLPGQPERDEGISRADRHANAAWKMAADTAVIQAALAFEFINTDDVLDNINTNAWTHELRALGGVMQRARKAGWIEITDMDRPCRRPSNHRRPLRLWRSLVYEGPLDE